jgi:hypothetical protein
MSAPGQRREGAKDNDPGVPEALPRILIRLRDQVGVENIDRLWIFPPVRRGRREHGLVAVSLFQTGRERREVVTVSYQAEHTGKGISVEPSFLQVGEAEPDRFPPVMEGVVRRSGEGAGEPREVEIEGKGRNFEELMEEYDDVFIEVVDP